MKKKIIIGVLIFLVILIVLGAIFLNKAKTYLSMDNLINIMQVEPQYDNEKITSSKKNLDFTELQASMDEMPEGRYQELEKYIVEADIDSLQKHLEKNDFTGEELVIFYLKRIQKLDPKLNTIITLNPDAIKIARELDEERNNNQLRGNLHGIPMLLKDNIATNDQMPNTAGAKVLESAYAKEDAPIVKNLRKEGAVILGKANLSEWANYMTGGMPNGYSALGGQTHNAYGKFDVGGSSSGSAASVAANFCTLSLGTETSGSLIYPSSENSVVAIKPTIGFWSNERIIPIAESQDTAGPVARNVKDAATLLGKLTDIEEYKNVDYTKFLDKNGLKGIKVGLVDNEKVTKGYREEDEEILNRVVDELEKLGAKVVRIKLDPKAFNVDMLSVLSYEYKKGVNNYLKGLEDNAPVKSLEEIVAYNKEDLDNRAPFGQSYLEESLNNKITDAENQKRVAENRAISRGTIDEQLKDVDVILSLSNYISGVYASAGYPAITLPAGYRQSGEPIGITLVGTKFSEDKLVKYAYAYEQGTKNRKEPKL